MMAVISSFTSATTTKLGFDWHALSQRPAKPARSKRPLMGLVIYRDFAAASRMEAIERSTSSSVVAHEETLIRIASRPCHRVPPHQQTPAAWIALMTRLVLASSPKATSTWFSSTWFKTSCPAARSAAAIRAAWRAAALDQRRDSLAAQPPSAWQIPARQPAPLRSARRRPSKQAPYQPEAAKEALVVRS